MTKASPTKMSDIQSIVGELVSKLHANIDHLNHIVQSHSDESYNFKLEQLTIQRESAIHSLREKRVDALKQILAQRAQEKEETSKKRARERQLIEERRIKEWEEILARRKIEDEKWLQAIEAEDQEIEKSRSYEDEEREREREEEERALFEKSENEIETLENEMQKSLEEGRITLKKLDEDRKIINAQIEAALSAPTIIPNLSFRSRRKKSRDLYHNQLEKPRNDSNCENPDTSLATTLENGEVDNSSSCTEETVFEKSISDGISSIRSSTSSSSEPKELRLVSLMQKEMSEEASRKRESVLSQKSNSSKGSLSSVDLTKRLSTWKMTSEVISKDTEPSRVVPAQEALASEEQSYSLLSVFPIKYVHNKTNSRIARSKSIGERSKNSYSFNLKKKVPKANGVSGVLIGQTSHDNNDECQISPSNDKSEISYANDSGTERNNTFCETSQINEKSTVLHEMSLDHTDIPTRQDHQITEHKICVASTSEQENLNQKLETSNEPKLKSPSENDFKSSKISPIKLSDYPEESVKEKYSISNKMEYSSKQDYAQETNDILALEWTPEPTAIKDAPHPIAHTTSPKEEQIKQIDPISRLDDRALDAELHSYPRKFVPQGSTTTTPIKSEISSPDTGDESSSTYIKIPSSNFPDLLECKDERTEEILSEIMKKSLPKSPQLSEQIPGLFNASPSESKSQMEKNSLNNISDMFPLTELNEQEFILETSSQISQSSKEEVINSNTEQTVTDEIGTSNTGAYLDPNEIREVNCDETQSYQVTVKYTNTENVTQFECTEKHLDFEAAEEDSIDDSKLFVSMQHIPDKEIDVLEKLNNMQAISSDDHLFHELIEENNLCQIERNPASLTTTLEQKNKQVAPIDSSCISDLSAEITSSTGQDLNKIIIHKATDQIAEEKFTNRQELQSNLLQLHIQGETSKFVMLPSNMRYRRNISRDIAALKHLNASHNMQPNVFSNSQPSTALTLYTDDTTETNKSEFKKQFSEISSDNHSNNCQTDLPIEENPELEKFELKDNLEICSMTDHEQVKNFTNGRVEPQNEIFDNQQKISLISDIGDLPNNLSSEQKSSCESPSHTHVLPNEHNQTSNTSFSLPISGLKSHQLGEVTSDVNTNLESTQKNNLNDDTSIITNKSNEDISTQSPENGDLNAHRHSNSNDINLSAEAGYLTEEIPKKSQFTYTDIEKDVTDIHDFKNSELNCELGSLDLVVRQVEEESLPELSRVINSIEDSMLSREKILYSPIVDINKLTRRLSYDSSVGCEKLKGLGTELTKKRKLINNKTERNNVPLSRTHSENDLTKMMKKYLDKDIINLHRVSSVGSNDITTKEEITSNIMHESLLVSKHSISTISSEEPLSPKVEITNTKTIASSKQELYKENSKEDDQENKNITRIIDSEVELCNSHLHTNSNTLYDPRNPLVDQANNEYQHELSIQPSIQPSQNSEVLTPLDTTESDQATSVSTASFFQKARALFDKQQKQPILENHRPVAKKVRPLSGLLNLRGGFSNSKQRLDNNFSAISEDEETNVLTSPIENSIGPNRSYTSMSHPELSKPPRFTAKPRYLRTDQSRLSFYESLQRAASASTSPIHSPVF